MTTCCEPVKPGPDGAAPADRRTFLFHIGLPKTGSTSIQHALVALADDLRARGIWVPYDRALYGSTFPNRKAPRGAPQTDGFAHFFRAGARRSQAHGFWQDAVENFLNDAEARAFVVSHENISQAGGKLRKDRFSAIAPQADIRFLVYLRAPLSYLSSYCLQLVYGLGRAMPRADQLPVRRYLAGGYAGLLAPFEAYGQVDARSFDALRKDRRLVPDFFTAIGAPDLAERAGRLESQNTRTARFNLACVAMALKHVTPPQEKPWFAMRRILWAAGEALEEPIQTSFLPAGLGAEITARWDRDRDVLLQRYGVAFGEAPEFRPGPEVLSFSADYAAALQEAAAPDLSDSQKDWLAQALTLAGQDLEEVLSGPLRGPLRGQLRGQPKTVPRPRNPTKGESIMSDEAKAKVKVSKEDTAVLARAMFKAQNNKGDTEAGDKASFKSVKDEMLPLARRTLKVLKRRGYSLSK